MMGRTYAGIDPDPRQPNYIGGDPSQGRYAMASDPGAPPEPPMSTTGKSYYEHNHWTGKSTDPREGKGGKGWGKGA